MIFFITIQCYLKFRCYMFNKNRLIDLAVTYIFYTFTAKLKCIEL